MIEAEDDGRSSSIERALFRSSGLVVALVRKGFERTKLKDQDADGRLRPARTALHGADGYFPIILAVTGASVTVEPPTLND